MAEEWGWYREDSQIIHQTQLNTQPRFEIKLKYKNEYLIKQVDYICEVSFRFLLVYLPTSDKLLFLESDIFIPLLFIAQLWWCVLNKSNTVDNFHLHIYRCLISPCIEIDSSNFNAGIRA